MREFYFLHFFNYAFGQYLAQEFSLGLIMFCLISYLDLPSFRYYEIIHKVHELSLLIYLPARLLR